MAGSTILFNQIYNHFLWHKKYTVTSSLGKVIVTHSLDTGWFPVYILLVWHGWKFFFATRVTRMTYLFEANLTKIMIYSRVTVREIRWAIQLRPTTLKWLKEACINDEQRPHAVHEQNAHCTYLHCSHMGLIKRLNCPDYKTLTNSANEKVIPCIIVHHNLMLVLSLIHLQQTTWRTGLQARRGSTGLDLSTLRLPPPEPYCGNWYTTVRGKNCI